MLNTGGKCAAAAEAGLDRWKEREFGVDAELGVPWAHESSQTHAVVVLSRLIPAASLCFAE